MGFFFCLSVLPNEELVCFHSNGFCDVSNTWGAQMRRRHLIFSLHQLNFFFFFFSIIADAVQQCKVQLEHVEEVTQLQGGLWSSSVNTELLSLGRMQIDEV